MFKQKELIIVGDVPETKRVLLETVTFTLCLLKRKLHIRKADVFNTQLSEIAEAALAMQDQCDIAV